MTDQEIKYDLEKCIKILDLESEIRRKYRQFHSIEDIKRVLEICEKYGVNPSDCDEFGFKYNHGFNFKFVQEYRLTNRRTRYKIAKDEWCIRFQLDLGRLNFINGATDDIYAATDGIWKDFVNVILSYEPLDYDLLNYNYIFSIENGYRLWKDFDSIYRDYHKKFSKVVKEFEIKKLEDELKKLKGE